MRRAADEQRHQQAALGAQRRLRAVQQGQCRAQRAPLVMRTGLHKVVSTPSGAH